VAEVVHNAKRAQSGQANTAALLTWFIPGAGHLYLGRGVVGLLVFVLVEGLYFLGLKLANGMTFEFLDAELRTIVAPVLSPEAGNLGGILWQMKAYGFGDGHLREWPAHIVLGSALTATSGVLNAVAMIHAHLIARTERASDATRPVLSTLLAWVCPGLGHVHQGRVVRGAIVFALIVGLFVLGTVLAEGSNLSRERHFYYWAGQFLVGGPAQLGEALFGSMRVAGDIPYVEAGLVFGCVAGLLNVLAMIDVYGYGEAKLFGWPLKHGGERKSEAPEDSGSDLPKLGEISV